MKNTLLFLSLFATGCAFSKAPDVVRVEVPISVPCKMPLIQKPAFAVDALQYGSDIWAQMSALRAERLQRKAYEAELEAATKACQ